MLTQPTLDADLFPDALAIHRHHYLGRCPVRGCKVHPLAADQPERTVCSEHRRPFKWEQVLGSYSHGIRCDARCQFAKGPACDCSCAGANHGAGWMA